MTEKILIIGATGNNGFRVAKTLLEQKRAVVVAARSANKQSEELKKLGAEVVEFDFAKPDTITAAVKGISSIFLLAPFVENSVNLNKLVIDAAKSNGVKFILRFSAAGADEKHTQHVRKDHGSADVYLRESGIDYAIIQPTFFFTNLEWQAQTVKAYGVLSGSSGTTKFNGIHPDDIADVAVAILLKPSEHKGQTYWLTGSSADVLSGDEIAQRIGASIGKEVKYVDSEPEAYQATLQKYGQPAWMASDVTHLEQIKRKGEGAHTSDHVKKITGKEPRTFGEWLAAARHLFVEEKKEEGERILVLGATGTNGSRVTRALLEKKKKVLVGLRNPTSKEGEEFKKQGVEVIEFDYSKPTTVTKGFTNIHSVFLLVPLLENTVEAHNAAVDAAKAAGVKFIVSISALGADSKSPAHIVKERGLCDDYLKASGVNYSLLLPTFFYTNFLRQADSIKKGVISGASGGDNKYSHIDPDDIADVAVEILLNQQKHVNTAYTLTGHLYTDNEIAHLLGKELGKEVKYIDSTLEARGAALSSYGMPKWIVDDLVYLENVKRSGWATTLTDTVKTITGKEPRTFAHWIAGNRQAFIEKKEDDGRILVLGATGTNGARVARGLLEKKKKVVVGLRTPDSKQGEEFKKLGAEVIEFDFTKSTTITNGLKNVHSVFLLLPFVENTIEPNNATVDAAKAAGVKFVVSLSASGADAKASAHLPKEHGICDDYLKASGLDYSILRPTFFFTNQLWNVQSIKNHGVFSGASGGDSKYTLIDPDDIADVAIEILSNPQKHKNTVYHLTGSKVYTDNELAKIISGVLGKEVKYVEDTDRAGTLAKYGTPKWQVDDLVFLENVKKNGWAATPSDSVKQITGREPRTFESWFEANKLAFS